MRSIASLSLLLAAFACTSSLRPVPDAWRTVPEAARITDLCARVACAERAKAPEVHVAAGRLYNGERGLTPPFLVVQSFDVSLERKEVVFSAKRTDNFDIGLVSLEGSDVHWFPTDHSDETDVQWAPRGNKVSYVVHTGRGDIVRTLHVPTSMSLVVNFTNAQVDALAWDPPAERYAVLVESPDASQRVEQTKYDGQERKTIVPAAERLDVTTEPFAGALILRPPTIRYEEKLPLVIWLDDHPLRWSDARAALLRNARLAVAVVSKPPDQAFWNEVGKTKWIDMGRVYAVWSGRLQPAVDGLKPVPTLLIEDAAVPQGFYRDDGGVVRARDIQSFAAGYITHELKSNGIR